MTFEKIFNKGLGVPIKAKIEQELTQVAVSKQSKPLKVVKPAAVGGKNKPPKKEVAKRRSNFII